MEACRTVAAAVARSVARATAGDPTGCGRRASCTCSTRTSAGSSCPWRLGFGPGQTRWRRLGRWHETGVFDRPHRILLAQPHAADELDWSRACVDASHIRSHPREKREPGPTRRRSTAGRRAVNTAPALIPAGLPLTFRFLTTVNRGTVGEHVPDRVLDHRSVRIPGRSGARSSRRCTHWSIRARRHFLGHRGSEFQPPAPRGAERPAGARLLSGRASGSGRAAAVR